MEKHLSEYTNVIKELSNGKRIIRETVFHDIVEIIDCKLDKDNHVVFTAIIVKPFDETFKLGDEVLVNSEDTIILSDTVIDVFLENEELSMSFTQFLKVVVKDIFKL